MDNFEYYFIIGSVWFVCSGGLCLMEQEKRKHEDGTYSPKTLLSYILGLLFLGPYFIGIWVGLDTIGLASLLPPFAMFAFLQLLLG